MVLYYSEINHLNEDFIMRMPKISLLQWQKRYGTEKACISMLAKYRWPNGKLKIIKRHFKNCLNMKNRATAIYPAN